jgi:hypothetical protein
MDSDNSGLHRMLDTLDNYQRLGGEITTLLDLTPRDFQDNHMFPLSADKTWWLPDSTRRLNPFSLSVQEFPFRGPTAFGQRFTFDVKSVGCGDLLLNTVLSIELGHWLDDTTLLRMESGKYTITSDFWTYVESLGSIIVEKAELEIGDSTIETIDGDFLKAAFLLGDPNSHYGISVDGLGTVSPTQTRPFPTTDRTLYIPLPFFFSRIQLKEALPLLACREGSVRIHVTLRPFHECVKIQGKSRVCSTDTPLGLDNAVINYINPVQLNESVKSSSVIPQFKKISLITQAANTDGEIRQKILKQPFEILIRTVSTFYFEEPLKYATNKSFDTVTVQLPLELNHPMEEIIWFVRRKGTHLNNEWTNYSNVLNLEYDPIFNPRGSLLKSASLQLNGVEIVNSDEQYFRRTISSSHLGGGYSYFNYLYGYCFSNKPGQHQPSGTLNASRLQTIRLTLQTNAISDTWEVKVFVISLQWLRFQNGIANQMFQN